MIKIFSLSLFFSKSLLKQNATQLMVILAIVLIAVAWLMGDVNIAKRYKLFEDVLLTSQMFLFHLLSIFYIFEFLQKERLGGIFVLPLSTGLSRKSYLLSVFLSQGLIITLFFSVIVGIDILSLLLIEGEVYWMVFLQLFYYYLSALLLSSLVIMFSQYVSIMNSMIYALILFILGGALDEFYIYAHSSRGDEIMIMVSTLFFYIVPNFSLFDIQGIVVNRADYTTQSLIVEPLIYIVIILNIIFALAYIKFKKRVLSVGI